MRAPCGEMGYLRWLRHHLARLPLPQPQQLLEQRQGHHPLRAPAHTGYIKQ